MMYQVLWKALGIKMMLNHFGPKGAYILLGETNEKAFESLKGLC